MRRINLVLLMAVILGSVVAIYSATIVRSTKSISTISITLEAGERIIVVEKGATVTIKPTTAKKLDYVVSEGKTLNGVLNLK